MDAARREESDAIPKTVDMPELKSREQVLDDTRPANIPQQVDPDHQLSELLPYFKAIDPDCALPMDPSATASNLIDSIAVEAVTIPPNSKITQGLQHFGSQHGSISPDVMFPAAEKQIGDKQIDEYCDDRCLDVPSRLKLFIQVCAAIHAVHQHAVIHCNLKPSNIIVTVNGVPKVLHSGTEMLVQHEPGDSDGAVTINPVQTQADESAITPEYLSPEQVKGETVTTASDVYALGILLYHLLTGRWPYRVTSRDASELLKAICEQLPEKPSNSIGSWTGVGASSPAGGIPALCLATPEQISLARGVSPQKLKRMLKGDLDSIVSMALQKEPERRYPSAAHLAEDLTRFLQRMPVHARRYFPAYRSSRFMRRHGAVVAAGFLSLLVFFTAWIALTRNLMTARHERDHTEEAFRQARHLLDQTLARISDDPLLNQPGFFPLRQVLLREAKGFYENYLNQHSADPQPRAEQATAQICLARITSLTGSRSDAIASYGQAVALWKRLCTKEPENLEYQANLAQTLNELGLLLLPLADRLHEALNAFLQAQKLNEQLVTAQPELPSHQLQLGVSLLNIAEIGQQQGKFDEAIELVERVLEMGEPLAAQYPDLLEPRIALATASATLGRLWAQDPAELPTAIASYEHAIEIHELLTQQHPQLIDQSYLQALELSKLSGLQAELGQHEPALKNLHRSLQIYEHIVSLCTGVPLYEEGLGTAYNSLSDMERKHGDQADALALADKARNLFAHLLAENPDSTPYRRDLAQSYNNLGRLQSRRAETLAALRSFQHAVDLYESLQHPSVHDSYALACNIALCIPLITGKNTAQSNPQELTKGDRLRYQLYGDRAIESLRRSFRGGYLDSQILQDDTDLDAIRTRADFKALVKEVENTPTTRLK